MKFFILIYSDVKFVVDRVFFCFFLMSLRQYPKQYVPRGGKNVVSSCLVVSIFCIECLCHVTRNNDGYYEVHMKVDTQSLPIYK